VVVGDAFYLFDVGDRVHAQRPRAIPGWAERAGSRQLTRDMKNDRGRGA
jgi:hypothetical protein